MTTIKEALISRLKNLPEDITLNEVLRIIREEWQVRRFGRKEDKTITDKTINTLKSKFEKEIEKFHKGIGGLKDNWDLRGARGFDNEILNKSRNLLREILFYLWDHKLEVPIPVISPCSDGSIDINWETEKFELLVNIPSDNQDLVSMYGEKTGSREDEIEVRIKFELVKPVIIEWLKMIV